MGDYIIEIPSILDFMVRNSGSVFRSIRRRAPVNKRVSDLSINDFKKILFSQYPERVNQYIKAGLSREEAETLAQKDIADFLEFFYFKQVPDGYGSIEQFLFGSDTKDEVKEVSEDKEDPTDEEISEMIDRLGKAAENLRNEFDHEVNQVQEPICPPLNESVIDQLEPYFIEFPKDLFLLDLQGVFIVKNKDQIPIYNYIDYRYNINPMLFAGLFTAMGEFFNELINRNEDTSVKRPTSQAVWFSDKKTIKGEEHVMAGAKSNHLSMILIFNKTQFSGYELAPVERLRGRIIDSLFSLEKLFENTISAFITPQSCYDEEKIEILLDTNLNFSLLEQMKINNNRLPTHSGLNSEQIEIISEVFDKLEGIYGRNEGFFVKHFLGRAEMKKKWSEDEQAEILHKLLLSETLYPINNRKINVKPIEQKKR
jgi:hypothetical protein